MTLSSGTRLGPYEIQATIDADGMGEVYNVRSFVTPGFGLWPCGGRERNWLAARSARGATRGEKPWRTR